MVRAVSNIWQPIKKRSSGVIAWERSRNMRSTSGLVSFIG
jgi:hypothetical protein